MTSSSALFVVIALLALGIWVYLLAFRGRFWLSAERDDTVPAAPPAWPSVAAVIPARNEAASIGATIASLMRQDYQGNLAIFLVDDESEDGTGEVARSAATAA